MSERINSECAHGHGDMIQGMWVCGQCFEKLPARPVTYTMERIPGEVAKIGNASNTRQVAHYAPISTAPSGLTLGQFITAMARHLTVAVKGTMPWDEAVNYSIEILRCMGDQFGDECMEWTSAGAKDLIADDLSSWDHDGNSGNGEAA